MSNDSIADDAGHAAGDGGSDRPATGTGTGTGTGGAGAGDQVYDRGRTVCVIGAGASGLAAIKNLRERGFPVDCYERETGVGGAWNWRHDRSPVYASMHLVTSKPGSQYPDFPMPDHWPDYVHHTQMLAYLERYADHFGLREHIWFGTEVARVASAADDPTRYEVTIRGQRGGSARTLRYAAVVIANGHHWSPNVPDYPGLAEFRGSVRHAAEHTDPVPLRGRKVLVIGAGTTGCEIAAEAAPVATVCWHSSRRGHWYVPEYLLGRPTDQVRARLEAWWLPQWLRRSLVQRLLALTVGDLTRFGLPVPDHRIFETHPTAAGQLLHQIGHGGVRPVPGVARFDRHDVTLTDGRVIQPDVVIFATGYVPRFEFLDPAVLGGEPGAGPYRPRLRWQVFPPDRPTLAVVGLIRPDAGLLACAHWQSALVASWLRAREVAPDGAGRFWQGCRDADPPPDPGGRRGLRRHRGRRFDAPRHWFEVSRFGYLRALERALHELESIA